MICLLYFLDNIASQIRSFHRSQGIQVLQHIFLRMTITVAIAREPRWVYFAQVLFSYCRTLFGPQRL